MLHYDESTNPSNGWREPDESQEEREEFERLKVDALAIINKDGIEVVIDRLVDIETSSFIDCSSTDRADIYTDLLLTGFVGYKNMDKEQLATHMAGNFAYLVEEWESEECDSYLSNMETKRKRKTKRKTKNG